jgi:integrase
LTAIAARYYASAGKGLDRQRYTVGYTSAAFASRFQPSPVGWRKTMGKFAKSERQAASVMKCLQGGRLQSVGTVRNYEDRLKLACDWMKAGRRGSLRDMTPQLAQEYLAERADIVQQPTLDMDRQAIQCMMQHVTHHLRPDDRLERTRSTIEHEPECRAYTRDQVDAIIEHQTEHNALATEIAYTAGLRASELLEIQPWDSGRKPDDRSEKLTDFQNACTGFKFEGREDWQPYTVQGKGGLIREIRLPHELAARLERYRRDEPIIVTDRRVHREFHYAIGGGQAWSQSFSSASRRALEWSAGAHGVRHAYAQERLIDLQNREHSYEEAKATVAQEVGHFKSDTTLTYLR